MTRKIPKHVFNIPRLGGNGGNGGGGSSSSSSSSQGSYYKSSMMGQLPDYDPQIQDYFGFSIDESNQYETQAPDWLGQVQHKGGYHVPPDAFVFKANESFSGRLQKTPKKPQKERPPIGKPAIKKKVGRSPYPFRSRKWQQNRQNQAERRRRR